MPKKKTSEAEVRISMKVLGIYKHEFEPIIKAYGRMQEQYEELTRRFEQSGYAFEVSTNTGSKKAPIVATLESLRRDVLASAVQLGLTPSGLKKINDASMKPKRRSTLAEALKELGG